MDKIKNPYSPGAGSPPPELAGRDKVREQAHIAMSRIKIGVGHALRKVDAARNPELKPIVEQRYTAWKADPERARIFFEFIEQERNLILKEYEVRIEFSPMITTSEATHAWRVGSNIFCPVASGYYAAQDVRDVLREAVAWWDAELNRIVL
jgi:hypothetical protein